MTQHVVAANRYYTRYSGFSVLLVIRGGFAVDRVKSTRIYASDAEEGKKPEVELDVFSLI